MSHKIRQGPRLAFAEFKFPPANAELEGPWHKRLAGCILLRKLVTLVDLRQLMHFYVLHDDRGPMETSQPGSVEIYPQTRISADDGW